MKTRCPRCGAEFVCGAGTGSCWCNELPPLPITKDISGETCFCRSCLQERVREEIAAAARPAP